MHAGSTDQTDDSQGQRIAIEETFLHEDYNIFPILHDVALVYLSEPLVFNENVQPVRFAQNCNVSSADLTPGQNGILTGWGFPDISSPIPSDILMSATMPLISVEEANLINQNAPDVTGIPEIPDDHLTFYLDGIQQSNADSGGPWVITKGGQKIQVGVASYSFVGPGPPDFTAVSVAMNVLDYADWIEEVTGINQSGQGVDLYSKDRPWDMGYEPSDVMYPWESEDIWIRNQNDGIVNQAHQNPNFGAIGSRYIYVRVRNRGCEPSFGADELTLNWGKASTAMFWPMYWNGSISLNPGGHPLGGLVGTQTIPSVEPGGSTILTFEWTDMPNPSAFQGLNEEPWHFCLLSRIESTNDPMSAPETIFVASNVLNNNNIVWKNFSIVSFLDEMSSEYLRVDGATVAVGGQPGQSHTYDFMLTEGGTEIPNLWRECEIVLKLGEAFWEKWDQGGRMGTGIEVFRESSRWLKVIAEPAVIENVLLNSGEYAQIGVQFGFLTREASEQPEYSYRLIQKDRSSGITSGGELFKLTKPNPERNLFYSSAGSHEAVMPGEIIELNAFGIGEAAEYNWYDASGNLVYTGPQHFIQADSSQVLKLEVIADSDGFKDYDTLHLEVMPHYLKSIYPNPSSSILNVDYKIDLNEGESLAASLSFVRHSMNEIYVFPINSQQESLVLDVSTLPIGN